MAERRRVPRRVTDGGSRVSDGQSNPRVSPPAVPCNLDRPGESHQPRRSPEKKININRLGIAVDQPPPQVAFPASDVGDKKFVMASCRPDYFQRQAYRRERRRILSLDG